MQIVEYRGWKNNLLLTNGEVELIVTLDVGPRVICYRVPGGFNVMKNYQQMMGGTNEPEWQIRGGHRFWLAPEDLTRTYFADNRPVTWKKTGNLSVDIIAPPETEYGVQKTMSLSLQPKGTKVDVTLTVTNTGTAATELAPWGPTVMAPGGVEVIPLPAKYNHPGHVSNAKSPADYGPNQELVLWPYFDFADTRWQFGAKYILLRQDVNKGPTKIGLAHREGWVGYVNSGVLFVKRFDYRDRAIYPDRGTRYQTFSNEDMLEMETCGELVTLAPGKTATLKESWELHTGVKDVKTDCEVDAEVLPRVKR
ncbi:hypothetical protein BH11PLA2_BH11PLA2_21770 [soil metagenome]